MIHVLTLLKTCLLTLIVYVCTLTNNNIIKKIININIFIHQCINIFIDYIIFTN